MRRANFKVKGIDQIRLNNPQSVDPLNEYAIRMKAFTNVHHSRRDEEHYRNQRDLEVESKLYWDDTIGVYIPASWIMESLAAQSFKLVKVAKKDMRSVLFVDRTKIKLHYDGEETVNSIEDVALNPRFRTINNIKQGQARVIKAIPTFNNWWFEVTIDFDEGTYSDDQLLKIVTAAAERGGYGDFRPTYGKATIEDWNVSDLAEAA